MSAPSPDPHLSRYRFAAAHAGRLLGVGLVVTGVLELLLALLVGLAELPAVLLLLGLVPLLTAMIAAVVLRRTDVVQLATEGYRVRLVRGAGVTRARWLEVEDVAAAVVTGSRCVVIRLRDGRTTTIPVDVLAGSDEAFVHDLQEHLNRGHGYRRVGPAT